MEGAAQFVSVAKRILRELRALTETVSTSLLGVQKKIEAIVEEQQAKNQREQTPPILRAELEIPEPVKSNWKSDNTKKVRRELIVIGVNVLTLFSVGAYAFINYHMLCAMREANKTASDSFAKTLCQMQAQTKAQQDAIELAREDFQREQRPYIFATGFKPNTPVFEVGKPIRWDIQFINHGRSPALHLHTNAAIFIGKDAIKKVDDFFSTLPKGHSNLPGIQIFVPPLIGNGCPDSPSCKYTSVLSRSTLTPDDMKFMQTNIGGVIVAGRSWYEDFFSNFYMADFCYLTLPSGAISACLKHN